jgi:hypothetical protein
VGSVALRRRDRIAVEQRKEQRRLGDANECALDRFGEGLTATKVLLVVMM